MHFNCQVGCYCALVRGIQCDKMRKTAVLSNFGFFKRLLAQISKTTKYYFNSSEHKLGNSFILTLSHIRIFLTFVAIT